MKLRSRLTGAALVGTLAVFGLAACGGDDDTSNNDSDSSSQSSDEPSDEATEDSSEGDGDKPAKEDVVTGFATVLNGTGAGIPADLVDTISTCVVDNIYDEGSAELLQALADGTPTATDPADVELLSTATTTCTQEALTAP